MQTAGEAKFHPLSWFEQVLRSPLWLAFSATAMKTDLLRKECGLVTR